MSFLELAKARYSVRSYQAQPIEEEKVLELLEAARVAPTACNNQPQRIIVITEAEELKKVDQCTRYRFNAPAVFLVCYDKNLCWQRRYDGALSGEVDASIVTTHLMMAAHDIGLGSCWVMSFDPNKTKELFALPQNIVPVAILPVGYPAENAVPAAGHFSSEPIGTLLWNR